MGRGRGAIAVNCMGKCQWYRNGNSPQLKFWYDLGYHFCKGCNSVIGTEYAIKTGPKKFRLTCPCCHGVLASRPKNGTKRRERLESQGVIERIE